MKISELFDLAAAKSKANDDYDKGSVPYVTSTTLNNGVLKFVDPFADDKVFEGGKICISGLGFATVQLRRFLPKGNGGDSCTILSPKEAMSPTELIYYTAMFNEMHTWRLSFGRKGNKSRIEGLKVPPFSSYNGDFNSKVESLSQKFLDTLSQLTGSINQEG